MTINKKKKVLIFGVGYLGQPLFFELQKKGYLVSGVCRHKSEEDNISDIDSSQNSYDEVIKKNKAKIIILCWAPNSRGINDYKQTYVDSMTKLCSALKHHLPEQVIYTSSTGVYSDTPNRIVSELDQNYKNDEHHECLLSAESILKASALKHNFKACILRLSGLYGEGRIPCLRLLKKNEPLPGQGNSWLHLIHRDDAINCILACIKNDAEGIFIVSDNEHYLKKDLYALFAKTFSTHKPSWKEVFSLEISGKQLNTQKIKLKINWVPEYSSIQIWLNKINKDEKM